MVIGDVRDVAKHERDAVLTATPAPDLAQLLGFATSRER